jgi:hypothetical protein
VLFCDFVVNLSTVNYWRHHGVAVPTQKSHSYLLQLTNGTQITTSFDWVAQYADAAPLIAKKRHRVNLKRLSFAGAATVAVKRSPNSTGFSPIFNSTAGGVAFFQLDSRTMVPEKLFSSLFPN